MNLEGLKDEKELVSARIDELEIQMISARGKAVARLAAELDELEQKKEALKAQIASASAAASAASVRPAAPAAAEPSKTAAPPLAAPGPAKKTGQKKGVKKKLAVAGASASLGVDLETEVRELERRVEKREAEERARRKALERRRTELANEESEVAESEARLVAASAQQDPLVKHAVRLQRLFRRKKESLPLAANPQLAAIVKSYVRSDQARQYRERWRLLVSLCSLQESYAASLVVVREKYVAPMRKTNHTVTGASREDIQAMFGMIETLSVFEESLAAALHQRLYSPFHHPTIGDLVVRMCAVFPAYVEYAKSVDNAFAVMARLQKSGSLFGAYLEKLHAASGCAVSVTALLELPRSRVSQLSEVLTRLARSTHADHLDSERLDGAVQNVDDTLRDLAQIEQDRKEYQNMLSATRRIAGLPESVFLPGQKLILEQDVQLVEKKRVPYRLFLFADSVVLAAGAPSSKTFKYVEMMSLSGTRFNSLPDMDSVFNSFELQTMSRVWQFVCDTLEAKQRVEAAFAKTLIDLNTSSHDLTRLSAGSRRMSLAFAAPPLLSSASSSSSSSSSWFHLNGLRLESEVRLATMEANESELSVDKQLTAHAASLATCLSNEAALTCGLENEGFSYAAQLLDSHGLIISPALIGVARLVLKREPSLTAALSSLASSDCSLSVLATAAAAVLGARPWIAALLAAPLLELRKRGPPEQIAALVVAALSDNKTLRDLPPFVRSASAAVRGASQKHFRLKGDPDAAVVVFFGAAFVVGPMRWPSKFGLSVTDIPGTYLDALNAAFAKEANAPSSALRSALINVCANVPPLPVTVTPERCREQVLPSLVQQLQQRIDVLPGALIKPLAQCMVLLKLNHL